MEYILLGKTNFMVSRAAFSTSAISSLPTEEGVNMLRKAYDGGINFFQTAASSTETSKMLGYAFYGMRKEVFIACTSAANDNISLQKDLINTLDDLNSNYIDIYSLYINEFVPTKTSPDGLYPALLAAKADGNLKNTGFSTDSFALAKEALESGLYDVIFLSYNLQKGTTEEEEKNFYNECIKNETGLVLTCGSEEGLNMNVPLLFGYLNQFENIISSWTPKNDDEVQQIFYFESHPPAIDDKFLEELNNERTKNI